MASVELGAVPEHRAFVRAVANYPRQKTKLHDFFMTYGAVPKGRGSGKHKATPASPKYLEIIKDLGGSHKELFVELDDILDFILGDGTSRDDPKVSDLIVTLESNTPRAVKIMYEVVEEIRATLPPPPHGADVLAAAAAARVINCTELPTEVRVPYSIHIVPSRNSDPVPIHRLRASDVGRLVTLEGVVAKVSAVRPQLTVGAFRCGACQEITFQRVAGTTFQPLVDCQMPSCKATKRRGTLMLSPRDSKFTKRQQATIQEAPRSVPRGAIPRRIPVILTGGLTRMLKPGEMVRLGAVYIPIMETGFRHRNAPEKNTFCLEAHSVSPLLASDFGKALKTKKEVSTEVDVVLAETANQGHALYDRLAASLAPSIHGHDDVKRALLLQLVGGTGTGNDGDNAGDEDDRHMGEDNEAASFQRALKTRGDVHVLLMGDPGIAKSQLLVRISQVAPRAHLTCGKGASGVGLTASVVRDPTTGEFSLEGGAIVLADRGVCCIDEFDKMPQQDQTAVHEVMEQQTVSVAKAGLVATLNARTTILAAANPTSGRYDLQQSAASNIGLPPSLLSRFDIVFLLLDTPGEFDRDVHMARHLLRVHKDKAVGNVELSSDVFIKPVSDDAIREIIRRAKQKSPTIQDPALHAAVCQHYVDARIAARTSSFDDDGLAYVTPRTLLAILRLSQALARLRFSDSVNEADLDEAVRLMASSKSSVAARLSQASKQQTTKRIHRRLHELALSLGDDARLKSGWVEFKTFVEAAQSQGIEVGGDDLENVINTLVVSGTCLWNGPQKSSFQLTSSADAAPPPESGPLGVLSQHENVDQEME